MVRRCKVIGCTAGRKGYDICGPQQLSFFKVPKNPKLLEQWCQSLRQQLKVNDVVCELHFKKEDIVREYVSMLPNGKEWRLKRDRNILVQNAVPSLEPHDVELVLIKMGDADQENDCLSSNNTANLTINDIKEHLELYALPPAWSWLYTDKELMFINVNKITYETKFHLKLQEDLSLTMYAKETKIDLHFTVTSIDNLYKKFDELNEVKVCVGTGIGPNEGRSQQCTGVLTGDSLSLLKHGVLRCKSCQTDRQSKQRNKTS